MKWDLVSAVLKLPQSYSAGIDMTSPDIDKGFDRDGKPESLFAMSKRTETMPDGRQIIYYDFTCNELTRTQAADECGKQAPPAVSS